MDSSLDSQNSLVLIFGSSKLKNQTDLFEQIRSKFTRSIIMGCSTSGEIYKSEVFDDSLSIAVTRFDKTSLKFVTAPISIGDESFEAGKKLANELYKENLKAIFILSEGININGTELVRGVNSIIPDKTVISGGLAGDGTDFMETWILKDNKPVTNHVSMVGFYGDKIEISTGSVGGWKAFGPERKITKSHANILYELDHQPALNLYKKYLGEKADELPVSALRFPLSLKSEFMDRSGIVRTVLSVDEKKQSMTFAGDMPENSITQLMHASFDNLIEGAAQAAEQAKIKNEDMNSPVLSIAISCVGRRLVLGGQVEDEIEVVLDSLEIPVNQIGFYSYGEIAPNKTGKCDLHNQTMTLTIIKEGN
ncbi:MAG: FIST N-terminal domain-containing protein [Pseudomonadota bacterium]